MPETTIQLVNDTQPRELTVADVQAQMAKIKDLMGNVLTEGQHYGTIPGTDKPSLLKPGAEKINFLFRIGTGELQVVKEDMPNGHREITVKTPMIHIPTGTVIAFGVGSCSTMESKYRYRNAKLKCPKCGQETVIKGRDEYGGGWLCHFKRGGCGAKWPDGATEIEGQKRGKEENPDIADVYNTVLKMAAKRSYVDGTIKASAASDFFTQDVEDTIEGEYTPTEKPKTGNGQKPLDLEADKRKNIEAEIGKFAKMIGADSLSVARNQVQNLRDMVTSGGITPAVYMEKITTLRDELENKAAATL